MNIILIGMPGCGKSSVGVLLAKQTCKMFVDTDLIIQEEEKAALQEIIDQKGLDYFLKSEEESILSLTCHHVVIATGGSVIYSETAMKHLKSQGKIVFLDLSLPALKRRLKNIKTRGVAIKKGKTIDELYFERVHLYRKYADYTINCNGKKIEKLIGEIIKLFE